MAEKHAQAVLEGAACVHCVLLPFRRALPLELPQNAWEHKHHSRPKHPDQKMDLRTVLQAKKACAKLFQRLTYTDPVSRYGT